MPPDEFCMDSIIFDTSEAKQYIIHDIYQWVFSKFNMSKPLHQLALLVGIYVSKLIPDLFHNLDDHLDSNITMFAVTKAIREMAWISNNKRGHKGCKVAA